MLLFHFKKNLYKADGLILIISEKEIAAKRIASILSGNGAKEEKHYGVPVFAFENMEGGFKSIGLKGHIMTVDFPESYSNWFKTKPADLIEAVIEKIPKEKKIIQALKKVAKDADKIIIATDFDREGELIGYDAWEVIKDSIGQIPVKRARFSAITKHDISEAFLKLEELDLNLAFAGRARQDIDLIWGATLTRFISLISYQTKNRFLSVGRVQTPTLALIVDRELEINAFKVTPYWQVRARLANSAQEQFDALYRKIRILEEAEAKEVHDKITGPATVTQVKESTRKIKPLAPFNTTALIVAANSIGFSAIKTINTAENLYMNGYISYPRTDNTVYPPSIDLLEIVKMFEKSETFKQAASDVLRQKEITPSRGSKKTTDHPPIYPVSLALKGKISDDEFKLYELIVRRFMTTLLPEAKIKNIAASFDINGEKFKANGSNIIDAGWLSHYPYYRHIETYLPDLKEGEELSLKEKEILSKETKPPSRFNQGRLVQKMEEMGLGTKATRHSIIQTLITRGYIRGNPLEPTEKAIAVIKALKENAQKITSPDMTSELEFDMDQIAGGGISREEVVEISRKALREIMAILAEKKEEISKIVVEGVKKDLIVGKCTTEGCEGDLIIRQARKSKKKFIGCNKYPDCTTAFPLPQFGLVVTTENKCKICNHPMVKIINKGKRPWDLCINTKCPSKDENYKSARNKGKDKGSAD